MPPPVDIKNSHFFEIRYLYSSLQKFLFLSSIKFFESRLIVSEKLHKSNIL